MAASVQYRMVMKEKEDDLSLFHEMRNFSLLHSSIEFDDSLGSKPDSSFKSKITSTIHGQKAPPDDFLNSDNGKTDYDWLLTPPCIPLFPSLEKESQETVMNQTRNSKSHTTAPRTTLADPPVEPASRTNVTSRRASSSTGVRSSSAGIRRPSSSGGTGSTASRPATPTGRPTLPAIVKPLRSSTPTSRATFPSNKPMAPPKRSSTPTRSTARSSTPTARPSLLTASKSTSRPLTPTCRRSTPSSIPSTSASASRSSSVTKSGATTVKNPVPSRGNSPTLKSRPWKPSKMPGFSNDAPPNLRTSLPGRPASASRERPSAPCARPSSIETSSSGRPRRKPCSPSMGLASNGNSHNSGRGVLVKSRKYSNSNDEVNPVLMGTQMVERVVNMRKLAPPKQDDPNSNHNNSSGKSSSSQNHSGFGRSLSKKSLDMAMRHMDIRRSISGNLHSLMTDVPASCVYSVRSGSTKLRTIGASDSPFATSSSANSERSVINNLHDLDASEVEDIDLDSEQEHSSPTSQQDQ